MILKVELELNDEKAKSLEEFFDTNCIDKDKWLKRALVLGMNTMFKNYHEQIVGE